MDAMTGRNDKERAALDRLADELVDDILNTSDEDILAELKEKGEDPDRIAAEMRALFDQTSISMNKRRLAAAKAGAAAARRTSANVSVRMTDMAAARRRLRQVLDSAGHNQKLTMAARKEDELSDADVLGLLEDFVRLGIPLPEDDTQ
jgi:hypothetical protein